MINQGMTCRRPLGTLRNAALLLSFWGIAALPQAQAVQINELMASNSKTITDEVGEYEDWVELYNPTSLPVDVAGFFLSDNLDEPRKWQRCDFAHFPCLVGSPTQFTLLLSAHTPFAPRH